MTKIDATESGIDITFENVMMKTDLPYINAGDLRPAGDPSPAIVLLLIATLLRCCYSCPGLDWEKLPHYFIH